MSTRVTKLSIDWDWEPGASREDGMQADLDGRFVEFREWQRVDKQRRQARLGERKASAKLAAIKRLLPSTHWTEWVDPEQTDILRDIIAIIGGTKETGA